MAMRTPSFRQFLVKEVVPIGYPPYQPHTYIRGVLLDFSPNLIWLWLCTLLPLSEELAKGIPGAELIVFKEVDELIEFKQEMEFFQTVSSFINRC